MDEEINLLDKDIHETIVPSLMKYIQYGAESPIKDFYVRLETSSLENMEITLGPHCTEEDELQVSELRQKHGIDGVLKKSEVRIRKDS